MGPDRIIMLPTVQTRSKKLLLGNGIVIGMRSIRKLASILDARFLSIPKHLSRGYDWPCGFLTASQWFVQKEGAINSTRAWPMTITPACYSGISRPFIRSTQPSTMMWLISVAEKVERTVCDRLGSCSILRAPATPTDFFGFRAISRLCSSLIAAHAMRAQTNLAYIKGSKLVLSPSCTADWVCLYVCYLCLPPINWVHIMITYSCARGIIHYGPTFSVYHKITGATTVVVVEAADHWLHIFQSSQCVSS